MRPSTDFRPVHELAHIYVQHLTRVRIYTKAVIYTSHENGKREKEEKREL